MLVAQEAAGKAPTIAMETASTGPVVAATAAEEVAVAAVVEATRTEMAPQTPKSHLVRLSREHTMTEAKTRHQAVERLQMQSTARGLATTELVETTMAIVSAHTVLGAEGSCVGDPGAVAAKEATTEVIEVVVVLIEATIVVISSRLIGSRPTLMMKRWSSSRQTRSSFESTMQSSTLSTRI